VTRTNVGRQIGCNPEPSPTGRGKVTETGNTSTARIQVVIDPPQIQDSGDAVSFHCRQVQLDSKSWSRRDLDVAIADDEGLAKQVGPQGVRISVDLDKRAVRQRRPQVKTGDEQDRR
jgi:hypothetical protein